MPAAGDTKVRPLVGGIQLEARRETKRLTATLGLVWKEGYFVTAGHAVGGEGDFVGQPDESILAGKVEENFMDAGVDMALVKVLVGVTSDVNKIWVGEEERLSVTFEKDQRPEKGEHLWLQGARSGKVECTVYLPDVDITEESTGEKVKNVALLNLDSATDPGDSGAPVVGVENDRCYGVYGGKVVVEGKTYGWFSPFENLEWD